ncbi:MAG: hypothetical protein OES35_07690, partial [Chromatiales bacterium]|nr:hypothetical protein [Chromatiales bacterium]
RCVPTRQPCLLVSASGRGGGESSGLSLNAFVRVRLQPRAATTGDDAAITLCVLIVTTTPVVRFPIGARMPALRDSMF